MCARTPDPVGQERHPGGEQGGVREDPGHVLGPEGLHDGAQEHEHHGQQDDEYGRDEVGARTVVGLGGAQRLGGLDRHPAGHEPGRERAGDDDGRHGDEQAQPEGHPEVRADGVDGDERSGMRGHEAVKGGQAGQGGDADQDERPAGAPRDDHDDGDEQDDADLEEERDAHDEGDERHGPGKSYPFFYIRHI